jgi:hypothetical protein
MNETRENPYPEGKEAFQKINSPIEMARALDLVLDPKSRHSREREYSRDITTDGASGLPPVEIILCSRDFHYGELEEVYLGVRLKEPSEIGGLEYNILSEDFLKWFVTNGGDPLLAEKVEQMEDSKEKGRVQKTIMREGGYALVTKVFQEAESLGYFKYLRVSLISELERKRKFAELEIKIAEAEAKVFLDEFPQYSLFSNRFKEENAFYAAIPNKRKDRVKAMKITISLSWQEMNEGIVEFQLGSMKIDDQENLSRFHQIDPPELPSTGKYQQRWFQGDIKTNIEQAIQARRNILDELGK